MTTTLRPAGLPVCLLPGVICLLAAAPPARAVDEVLDSIIYTEPALARWDHGPARAAWLERLNQPGLPGHGWLLALRGLGAVREPKAVPRLRELALGPATNPIVRLEAARALGVIRIEGSEGDAE